MIGIESLDKTVTKMFYFGWRIARTPPVNLEPLFHKDYKQAKDAKLKKFLKSEITIDKKAFDARELNHLKNIPKSEVPYRLDFTLSFCRNVHWIISTTRQLTNSTLNSSLLICTNRT